MAKQPANTVYFGNRMDSPNEPSSLSIPKELFAISIFTNLTTSLITKYSSQNWKKYLPNQPWFLLQKKPRPNCPMAASSCIVTNGARTASLPGPGSNDKNWNTGRWISPPLRVPLPRSANGQTENWLPPPSISTVPLLSILMFQGLRKCSKTTFSGKPDRNIKAPFFQTGRFFVLVYKRQDVLK